MRPAPLAQQVLRNIRRHRLWNVWDRVAVAVSGGVDSVALLDLLAAVNRMHRAQLSVVTVDHGTRPGSAADADFVEALAADRRLGCVRVNVALGERASEDVCRRARYAAFDSLNTDVVAVGHHLDDQAETVLVALVRGTGTRGLAGMGWRRGKIARPLLDVTRASLVTWATERELAWVEDPTNASPDFLRNRLRHEVLPLLEDLRTGAARALARSATEVAADADLLDLLADDAGLDGDHWALERLRALPDAVLRRAFRRRLRDATSAHVEAFVHAVRRGKGSVALAGRSVDLVGDAVILTVRDNERESGG